MADKLQHAGRRPRPVHLEAVLWLHAAPCASPGIVVDAWVVVQDSHSVHGDSTNTQDWLKDDFPWPLLVLCKLLRGHQQPGEVSALLCLPGFWEQIEEDVGNGRRGVPSDGECACSACVCLFVYCCPADKLLMWRVLPSQCRIVSWPCATAPAFRRCC